MSAIAASAVAPDTDNPFPGLRAFAEDEGDRFFGRGQQINELATRLTELPFLAVSGNSGCGKSSLVRAGLLRELSKRAASRAATTWLPVVMVPGDRPIASLSKALAAGLGTASDDEMGIGLLYGQLKLGGLGLVEAVKQANLAPRTRVLLVADQFEELFRVRQADADEASAFVKLLLNAALDAESPVSVIITLRSDFLGSCADFRGLPETVNRGLYLVPRLTREQRKEAIIGPVELRSQRVTARLVQRILNDVSDDFDDLPIMQHALARTWNHWLVASQADRPIDLEDYRAIGTTADAISMHADEAAESTEQLPAVERVFRALTEFRPQGAAVRRALRFNQLCDVVGERDAVTRVVERFRRPDTAFLQPGTRVALANNPVIDISHESLIRQWRQLRDWVRSEAESAAMLQRLLDSAARRASHQASLWRGAELKAALQWKKESAPTAAWVELYAPAPAGGAWLAAQRFLAASRRAAWLQKAALAVVPLGMLLLLLLYVATLFIGTNNSQSSALASKALSILDQDPARGARLALAALERNEHNEAAEAALRNAMARLEVAHTSEIIEPCEATATANPGGHSACDPVRDLRYSSDGKQLLVASGKTVWRFDANTFRHLGDPVTRQEDVLQVWLLNDNRTLITKTFDGKVQMQHLGDGAVQPLSCPKDDTAWSVAPTRDGRLVAIGCYSGEILVWDVAHAAAPPKQFQSSEYTITALEFSPDSMFLAGGDSTGKLTVWKLDQSKAWIEHVFNEGKQVSLAHAKAIRDLHFYEQNQRYLLSASDDGIASVWDLNLEHTTHEGKQAKRRWSLKHERPVSLAAFFPAIEGDVPPVFTVSGKNVERWVDEDLDAKQLRGHDDWINDVNGSPDGRLLVTASDDGTAKIWSTLGGPSLAVLRGHHGGVNRALFSPQGDMVLTASDDGSVRVWRFHAPQLLTFSSDWKLGAAFDPTGSRVAIADEAGLMCIVTLAESKTCSATDTKKLKARKPAMISFLSWSADGKYLFGLAKENTVNTAMNPLLWAVADKDWSDSVALVGMRGAMFRAGGDELLTLSDEGRLMLWDARQLTAPGLKPLIKSGPDLGWGLPAISHDGQWIAVGRGDDVLLWRRAELGSPPKRLAGFRGPIRSLQFSSDSTRLVAASDDRTARIWSVASPNTQPLILEGEHNGGVYSAAFDRTGTWVATGSSDGNIGVWDARSARLLALLHRHGEAVNSVQFSPDSHSILSASDDGTVSLDRCDVCTESLAAVEAQVAAMAKLSKDDERELQLEIRH